MSESNVMNITGDGTYSTTTASTTSQFTLCTGCNTYYGSGQWHTCPTYPYTYATPNNEVEELKAWLDGYLTDRSLGPKSLKKIRAKLDEFLEP